MQERDPLEIDVLYTHGFVITMNESREIFKDGAIALKDGTIVAVDKTETLKLKYPEVKTERDLKGAVVHPGLIDAHEHTGMHLARGWLPDYYSLEETYKRFEKPFFENVSGEDEFYGTVLACMEMVRNGTTAFGDTGSSVLGLKDIDNIIEAARLVGIRGKTGNFIADNIPEGDDLSSLGSTTDGCLRKIEYQLNRYPPGTDSLVSCWITLYGSHLCSDALLSEAKRLSLKYNSKISMHQSCYKQEVDEFVNNRGKRPIEHLSDLGLLGPAVSLVHMIFLNDREIELLAETGTHVVHCPGASSRNAMGAALHGFFPEMIKQGICVALGSDQGNSSDALDVLRMAYLASVLHKETRGILPAVSAEEALEMATVMGAAVLGMEREIGSLEEGKKADIVIHNRKHPGSHPPFDPVNNLIFSVQSKSVDTVLIDGKTVVEGGRIVSLDEDALYEKIDRQAVQLAGRMGYSPGKSWPII